MTHSQPAVLLLAFGLLGLSYAGAQQVASSPPGSKQQVLYLNRASSGQHVVATVGQPIEITLQTIGPGHYQAPQISCSAIRFERFAFAPVQNPGGPQQEYHFRAAAEGEAQVKIPHSDSNATFTVTIQVGAAAGCPPALHPSIMPDQANTAEWTKAWTNLVNDVQQTFTPSLPRLVAVEVELVLANPGPADDTLIMTLFDAEGQSLATASKTVKVADCAHVRFAFGGLEVSPGKVYSIRLSGGTLFGWKYVVGGYEKGSASFNGRPLLQDARSTLLFRTFGGT